MNDFPSQADALAPALPAHLYVHIPFCASKCDYCDFASVASASPHIVTAVFAGIRTQIQGWERSGLPGVLDTIYVGGGTPSLHAEKVADLIGFIRHTLVVHPAAEITVEANPDSLTRDACERFARTGVTRLSVGVQSFSDHELRVLGRRHDASQALEACHMVIDAGLSLSVDLMCAIPGQTSASWADTLRIAVSTGAKHLSVYPLAIEPDTPMQVACDAGLLPAVDSDVAAEHMVMAEQALARADMTRYEIANYTAGPEHMSRHNRAYWTGRPYAGVGPAAHGMVGGSVAVAMGLVPNAEAGVRVRYGNAAAIDDWLVGRGDSFEVLDAGDALREDAMLGMRLAEGIPDSLAEDANAVTALETLENDGLVEHRGGRWRATRRGWLLGNEVFARIWNADS